MSARDPFEEFGGKEIKKDNNVISSDPFQEFGGKEIKKNNSYEPMNLELIGNQKQKTSFFDKASEDFINRPITQGILGAGDAIRKLLSLGYAKPSPYAKQEDLPYQIGGGLGQGINLMLGGAAAKGLPYISKIPQALESIPFAGAPASRIVGTGLTEASQEPEDRMQAMKEGLASGALGEALFSPLTGLTKLAEKINPKKYLSELTKAMRADYQSAQKEMSDLYEPISKKYGNDIVTYNFQGNRIKPDDYLGYAEWEKKNLTGSARRTYEKFLNHPTYQNLHDYQSELGKEASRVAANDSSRAVELTRMRNEIQDQKIPEFFDFKKDPLMKEQHVKARHVASTKFYPYESQINIEDIAKGFTDPKKLKDILPHIESLLLEKQRRNLPLAQEHLLSKAAKELELKHKQAQAAKIAATLGAGALGYLSGPMASATLGAGTYKLAPYLLPILQHKNIEAAIPWLKSLTTGEMLQEHTPLELELIGGRKR